MSWENVVIQILHVRHLIPRQVIPQVSGNSYSLIYSNIPFTVHCFSENKLGTNLVFNTE